MKALFQKFINQIYHYFNIIYSIMIDNNITFFNTCSVVFLGVIFYFFFTNLDYNSVFNKTQLLGYLISFSASALITTYFLNEFKYSKNLFVRILQRFVLYSIFLLIIGCILSIGIDLFLQ